MSLSHWGIILGSDNYTCVLEIERGAFVFSERNIEDMGLFLL